MHSVYLALIIHTKHEARISSQTNYPKCQRMGEVMQNHLVIKSPLMQVVIDNSQLPDLRDLPIC